jgi:hypothetical protein
MSTKEENVDILIADYEKHRKENPKSKLPEVSYMNRKFLIDCNILGSKSFSFPQELLSVEGYVFLGSWGGKDIDRNKSLRNSTWFEGNVGNNYKNADLTGARFIGCEIAHINLMGANLTNVVFDTCVFTAGRMSGAKYENVKVIRPIHMHYESVYDDLDQVKIGWNHGFMTGLNSAF